MIPVGVGNGDLVTGPGVVQYGAAVIPGWADLIGWRDAPSISSSDTNRPQAHGSYPGDIWADELTVSLVYRLDLRDYASPADRWADVTTLERYLPIDGVDRPLVVDDGSGPTLRTARVIGRHVPQTFDMYTRVLECSVQWLCADPRRYSLAQTSTPVALGTSTGGLAYPLAYPLAYGTTVGGSRTVTNTGGTAAPVRVTFAGPLTNPALTADTGWRMAFRLTLADTETLVVDSADGTALLNGTTDRLYTIDPTASPIERCLLVPGQTTLSLSAAAGSGTATALSRSAYL